MFMKLEKKMKNKFYKTVLSLDKLMHKENVETSDLIKYKSLCANISLKIYFYRNLANPSWFYILNKSNELIELLSLDSKDNDSHILQLAISEYLEKVSGYYTNEVVKLIKKVNCTNSTVIWQFAEIGLTIPAKNTAQLVSQVKRW